jgi:colicin import membrane protein|tara:strand:+ start:190 stop:492 length:303 start_codon:yes stop_codon:yes gene_type:complete
MGKRNKRARTILKQMSILGEVPSLEVARRFGIEKEVQAEIDKREAIEKAKQEAEAEKQRLIEEAKKKAEAEKKRKAEAARKKKEAAEKKKKAAQETKASE